MSRELHAGFAKGSKRQKNIEELNHFLALPIFKILPVDRPIAETFGDIFDELRRCGRPIPVNDIWIAATCASAGATLLTWDAHFRTIPRIGSLLLGS